MAGPRLITARLIRLNRSSHLKTRGRIIAAAGFGVLLALLWVGRDMVLQTIDWLRPHSVVCGGLAAVASAIQVARRRVLKRAEFTRSWLAAVPIRSSTSRWEALVIETFPATAALVALAVLGVGCGLVLVLSDAGRSSSLLAIWACLSAGVAIGVIVGYAMPAPKPVDLPPGSRYVPHQRVVKAARIRPSLSALGYWPVRQMFAWAQPKMVARATIPILLAMPLGTTADAAMGAIAVFGVSGALVLLWLAAISVSNRVRGWMAPLPVRAGVVTRAFLLPTFAVMLGASSVEALLLLTFDASYRLAAAIGMGTAVVGCLATLGGVQLEGARSRRAGLRRAGLRRIS